MRHTVPTPRAFGSPRLVVLVLVLASAACDMPTFEGAQIQSPPPAFYMQPDAYQQRRMFPDLELVSHNAWVETSWGHFSGIFINGHGGALTEDDVYDAWEASLAAAEPGVLVENVEILTIDGRRAWGWAERLQTPELGLQWIAYRAMVPYDTISYAIELFADEPGLKQRPDTLKTIVASFAVGETMWNFPLIAVFVGMTLFLINTLHRRSKARAARLQSINLVSIKKDDEEEDGEFWMRETGAEARAETKKDPLAVPLKVEGDVADPESPPAPSD